MKKSKIIEVVLEHLRADFERRQAAARRTREQGNDAESKSEGKYDTRSIEENYLADGLARQGSHRLVLSIQFFQLFRNLGAGNG